MWSGKSLTGFGADVEKQLGDGVKEIAAFGLSKVIQRSPVDEGSYRAGNRITIDDNEQPFDPDKTDKSGNATLNEGASVLEAINTPFVRVTIYNPAPYARRIEDGWSGQAPSGVYALAYNDMRERYGK